MRLLLTYRNFTNLSMYENTNNLTILLDSFEILCGSGIGTSGFYSVFRKGLLFGFIPILVESSSYFVGKMGCPDCSERTESTGSFDVTNNTAYNHRRGLLSTRIQK